MNFRHPLCLAIGACASITINGSALAAAGGESAFSKTVAPFVDKHCVRCHGPETQKADLRLDGLDGARLSEDTELWGKILERLATGDMPPVSKNKATEKPRPSRTEIAPVVNWIHDSLMHTAGGAELEFPDKGNLVPHELLFGPLAEGARPSASPARLWRISPYQYQALISSVGGGPYRPARGFATKSKALPVPFGYRGGPGIQDYSFLYRIDEGQTEQLVLNARELSARVFERTGLEPKSGKEGDFNANKYRTPKALESLAAQKEALSDTQVGQFLEVMSSIVLRRPPTEEERSRYGGFLRLEASRFGNRMGMENTLAAYLLHPAAMFRIEAATGPADEYGRTMLAPLQLAQAICFALTDLPPDVRLMAAVNGGRLRTRDDVRREVDRILAEAMHPRENQPQPLRVLRFFQEYFGYTAAPDIFKDEDLVLPELRGALVNDTDRLIKDVLLTDRQVLRELLTTRKSYVMVDALRSPLYREAKEKGTPHPFGRKNRVNEVYSLALEDWKEEQPLEFPAAQRTGILTQPSWLIAHSTNDANHAIHRGKWIQERLLGGAIPDTPITVDAQLPDEPTKPLRERMRVTREEFCWKCHQRMDPLGLTLEMFDHWGRYRTEELGTPVDPRGEVIRSIEPALDGPVANAVELMQRLAHSDYVEQVFVRHAFRYWMGRNETVADAPTLQAAWRAYHDHDGSMNALVSSLLTSDAFLYRTATPAQTASEPKAAVTTQTTRKTP